MRRLQMRQRSTVRGSLNDEPGANEPNILNDEPFATVENEWLQLPVIYKRVINKRLG